MQRVEWNQASATFKLPVTKHAQLSISRRVRCATSLPTSSAIQPRAWPRPTTPCPPGITRTIPPPRDIGASVFRSSGDRHRGVNQRTAVNRSCHVRPLPFSARIQFQRRGRPITCAPKDFAVSAHGSDRLDHKYGRRTQLVYRNAFHIQGSASGLVVFGFGSASFRATFRLGESPVLQLGKRDRKTVPTRIASASGNRR